MCGGGVEPNTPPTHSSQQARPARVAVTGQLRGSLLARLHGWAARPIARCQRVDAREARGRPLSELPFDTVGPRGVVRTINSMYMYEYVTRHSRPPSRRPPPHATHSTRVSSSNAMSNVPRPPPRNPWLRLPVLGEAACERAFAHGMRRVACHSALHCRNPDLGLIRPWRVRSRFGPRVATRRHHSGCAAA